MKNLNVEIISAEGYVFQGEAHQVVIPCAAGDIGVMSDHEHVITEIREGKIEVLGSASKSLKEIDVKGGTAEVHEDGLRVLVEL